MGSEFDRIERLRTIFGLPPTAISVGIGDDAAIIDLSALQPQALHLVWTIDASVEGVHFTRALASWQDIGWRSLMAAASDLAAMAAAPLGALCALTLPADLRDDELEALAQGQAEAACALGTAIVGGNLSRGDEVSINTTLLGTCSRPTTRSGARPGDLLVVAGQLGLAACGLRALQQGRSHADPDATAAVLAWRRPVARIADGLRIGVVATSQIDVSDGLAQDAGHLAHASGVRIDLDARAIVSPELSSLCKRFDLDARQLVLGGGEDYALLATVPAHGLPQGVRVIGVCSEGKGVWIDQSSRVDHLGHDHFRSQ